ncbi:hypothetical protein [Bradyrhizobium sp. UNPA324]|uniref:hypothetical protein n=1 Tax=Bradyrhizobium sp. UNPA324 TaxID=1141174 RepID=UPI001152693D|nr:hypothetical protein [Bradyrhizobium sp. UNPA324]TQF29219.1 hypothetical protein UNPA324_05875 [Bradyrhizobium sp. UNPA324]
MTFSSESLDEAGVLAILVKHARASFIRRAAEKSIEEAKAQIKEQDKATAACEATLRLFGYDLNEGATWDLLMEKHRDRVFEVLQSEASTAKLLQAEDEDRPKDSDVPPALPAKRQMPTIQEILLERLQEAGDKGSKAAPLRDYIQQTYSIEIHEKTVGMTLYRLLRKGLVRREGHVWFFVPQTIADTKKPGDPPPGLLELLK